MDPRSTDDEPPVEAVEEGVPTFTNETPQVERNATTIEGWRHSVGTKRPHAARYLADWTCGGGTSRKRWHNTSGDRENGSRHSQPPRYRSC